MPLRAVARVVALHQISLDFVLMSLGCGNDYVFELTLDLTGKSQSLDGLTFALS